MRIRPFEADDEPAVIALWERCRRGHGRALMRRVEELLLAHGCPKVNVMARSANAEVVAFYRRLGYAPDEVVALGKRLITD